MTIETLDVAGIGVGPFNLSLAALLTPVENVRFRFFERRPNFEWQAGMMLPGTRMQTSFLKDLVTPVDPTSRFSFLAYLVERGRFYRFINAEFSHVHRSEFADYMRWAAGKIPNLEFEAQVNQVSFDGRHFEIEFDHRRKRVRARDIVIATGVAPHVPSWAQRHLGSGCLHSGEFMHHQLQLNGKRVVVIGGGQSGAEIFLNLVSGRQGSPSHVTLVSRRANLEPLDETAFVNEYFTPDYVQHFHQLPEVRRSPIVMSQKLAGDGVSPETLRELSQFLYANDFLNDERRPYRILTHREVRGMHRSGGALRVEMHNGFDHGSESMAADVVVLATGYQHRLPACLEPIGDLLARDAGGHLKLRQDYVAEWSGPETHRVYVQNGGRYSHGIADPQLSLAAWRSGVIANSVAGREVYRIDAAPSTVQWQSAAGGLLHTTSLEGFSLV